jgi:iron-sulfur cluster insertion protein
MSDAISTASLIITQRAAVKVWELIEEEENYDLKLRVYVTGGGCSGFQYGFTFDEAINEDDLVVKKPLEHQPENTVVVLADPMSFQYLAGAEIDYIEDVQGARFLIRNPNADTTCGCGSSFSVN